MNEALNEGIFIKIAPIILSIAKQKGFSVFNLIEILKQIDPKSIIDIDYDDIFITISPPSVSQNIKELLLMLKKDGSQAQSMKIMEQISYEEPEFY